MKMNERGFTLVELIVVLVIASIITTFILNILLNTLNFNKRILVQAVQVELDLVIEKIIHDILYSSDINIIEGGIEILTQEDGWVVYQIYNSNNGPALGYKKEKAISLTGEVEYTRIDSIIADILDFSWVDGGNILYLKICQRLNSEEQVCKYRSIHEGGRFWVSN